MNPYKFLLIILIYMFLGKDLFALSPKSFVSSVREEMSDSSTEKAEHRHKRQRREEPIDEKALLKELLKKVYNSEKIKDIEEIIRGVLNVEKEKIREGTEVGVGDLHGNLLAMLVPLVKYRFVKIDDKNIFAFFDTKIDKRIEITEIRKLDDRYIRENILCIPNVQFLDPPNTIIFVGDLIDRGYFSEECIYLLIDLLNQDSKKMEEKVEALEQKYKRNIVFLNKEKEKIKEKVIALCGNHELEVVKHEEDRIFLPSFFPWFRSNLHNTLKKYIINRRIKACYFNYDSIFFHALILESYLKYLSEQEETEEVKKSAEFFLKKDKVEVTDEYKKQLEKLSVYLNNEFHRIVDKDELNIRPVPKMLDLKGPFWARDVKSACSSIRMFFGHNVQKKLGPKNPKERGDARGLDLGVSLVKGADLGYVLKNGREIEYRYYDQETEEVILLFEDSSYFTQSISIKEEESRIMKRYLTTRRYQKLRDIRFLYKREQGLLVDFNSILEEIKDSFGRIPKCFKSLPISRSKYLVDFLEENFGKFIIESMVKIPTKSIDFLIERKYSKEDNKFEIDYKLKIDDQLKLISSNIVLNEICYEWIIFSYKEELGGEIQFRNDIFNLHFLLLFLCRGLRGLEEIRDSYMEIYEQKLAVQKGLLGGQGKNLVMFIQIMNEFIREISSNREISEKNKEDLTDEDIKSIYDVMKKMDLFSEDQSETEIAA
jgi:hypothetical protein